MSFTGLLWFILTLLPLVILQRLLHREIQAVLLIATRNPQLTVGLFSILFFPGVFLHELSHFVMAKILRVRTGKTSLIPKSLSDGRLQMGYVETAHTDVVRDSLIGLAPLIAGSLFIAYAGLNRLGLATLLAVLANGQTELFWAGLKLLPRVNDFFLWFYLAFAVSSTMLPSESDRHAWLPLGLWTTGLLALAIFAGAGAWMLENIAPLLNNFFGSVATLFGLSAALHVILLLPTLLLHRVVSKITGVDVK
ncbi:MAG: hypothetical protein Q7T89_00485 [Anaerolineales bacterium]|nr:hypothetical protein [Anaerolineales bacterium]